MYDDKRHVLVFERVACLECGSVYGKPVSGGTRSENPGCPTCGYVGWIAVREHGDEPSRSNGLRRTG